MSNLIILPLLIPLLSGVLALVRRRVLRRYLVTGGLLLNMLVSFALLAGAQTGGVQVSQMGGHPAPYGITLAVDALSAIMLAVTGVISFLVIIFSQATIDINHDRFAYYPLLAFLVMGVNFAFLTGDLFTLYVAFEVMLMASFVLLTLGGERGQIEGGIKYVTLNLISSTVFLIAAGLTYGVAGTLNIAHLAERLSGQPTPGITTILAALFLVAFGIKAAIFPLFFWLPASYHTPPVAVTAIFGGLLTKVGIYSMWRILTMIFPQDVVYLQPLILTLAGLTMIVGVLGALAQTDFRRLLSFLIISEIGYLVMGLGIFTQESMTGAVFFMVHVILAKTALFFLSGITHDTANTYRLRDMGGFMKTHPGVALLFLLAILGLAGTPPLSGFWAKLALIRAGLEAQQYVITGSALAVSLLILYAVIRIWHEVFWKAAPSPRPEAAREPWKRRSLMIPTALLVGLIVVIGILAEPLYGLSRRAAEGLSQPKTYVQTVLGERR